MRIAFERLASGEAINQPRRRLILPTGSVLHYMAGSNGKYFGTKIYASHARHGAYFLFLLYRSEDAQPLALLEANNLGQIRTGAASGLGTQLMARSDATVLGIIGSGFQASTQLEAMLAARPIQNVKVWSRTTERRSKFAEECSKTFSVRVLAVKTAEEAVRNTDIVVTATNAKDPVIKSEWISPGTHINAMGSNQAQRRELPSDLIARADLIAVDSLEQARMESGDLVLADWNNHNIVELQDLVKMNSLPPRPSDQAITIFKSNGLAVEDVAAAGYVYEEAVEAGIGTELPLFHS
jgi:ornithine cyclodeaminase/alanine dehydrogenase-like protein (mu-crystallin family)